MSSSDVSSSGLISTADGRPFRVTVTRSCVNSTQVEGCVISSTTERPPTPSTRRQIDDYSPQVDTAVVDRTFPPLRQRSGDRLSDEIFGGTRIADECSCEPLHTRTLRQSS